VESRYSSLPACNSRSTQVPVIGVHFAGIAESRPRPPWSLTATTPSVVPVFVTVPFFLALVTHALERSALPKQRVRLSSVGYWSFPVNRSLRCRVANGSLHSPTSHFKHAGHRLRGDRQRGDHAVAHGAPLCELPQTSTPRAVRHAREPPPTADATGADELRHPACPEISTTNLLGCAGRSSLAGQRSCGWRF
jgi:hypothetical protein